jgi:hypothetical protein
VTSGTPPADGPELQDPPDGDHPTFDTSVAHVARIYDYWLGGKDNYAVDRAAQTLDFSQPVAVVLMAILHLIPDTDDPYGIVAQFTGAVPAGSYLALSQIASDIDAKAVAEARDQVGRYMPVKQTYRSHAEVMRFFDGLEMVEPGLTPVQKWRPDSAAGATMPSALWGGVARKP